MKNSRISGLFRLSVEDRVQALIDRGFLSADDARPLQSDDPLLPRITADRMIENVIGVFGLPMAVAPNFLVNDKDYLVPMVVEEPSIVAGVSGAAKTIRDSGGFIVTASEPLLIGQVQVVGIEDPDRAVQALFGVQQDLLDAANGLHPKLVERGGGAREIEFFKYRLPDGDWTVVLHLLVHTCDAMGANVVNTMCEGIASAVETLTGGNVVLRILSNLADHSLVTAAARISLSALEGSGRSAEFVRDGIVLANDFALTDPYRAATHNKGIMNGVDAVAIATGNDWRAIEAGAHAYAVNNGAYRSLTAWSVADNGDLVGKLSLPLKVGIVGGSLSSNPGARIGLALTGAASATELAKLMGATGLAQNFAALRALVTDGIQKGHMRLHARSVAAAADVPEDLFDDVVTAMIESGDIKTWKAEELAVAGSPAADGELQPLENAAVGEASGKVILLGEHAVVYDRHALALPLPGAVRVEVAERESGMNLEVPDWDISDDWVAGGKIPEGAAAVIALIMQALDVDHRGFDVRVTSKIPIGVGLGSSAAFAVAAIRAFCAFLGLSKSDIEIDRIAFRCERLTHGNPSGVDNNLATFGEPVLYSRTTGTRTRPIRLSEAPPIVVASSSVRGSTLEMVEGVRNRFDRNEALYTTLFDEIDEMSVAGATALRERDYTLLGALMNVCHGYLNAIEVSTPELEAMVTIAREAGAVGAKLTGAGGGGSIVALCPGKVDAVADALGQAGYSIYRIQ